MAIMYMHKKNLIKHNSKMSDFEPIRPGVFRTRSQACCTIVMTIWRPGLNKLKLHTKRSLASPPPPPVSHFYLHLDIVCLKKYQGSIKVLYRFPRGGYTHAAKETVQNQLTIRQVFKTITILRSLELLYMRSTLRVGLH